MNLRRQTITVFALVLAATMPLYGQDKESRGRDSFDVERFLKKLDDNDNGMIDPSEVNRDRTRKFLKNAGADVSKSFSIKSFMKKLKKLEKAKKKTGSAKSVEQKSMGFSVAEQERDDSSGDSLGFAVLSDEREPLEQARTREFDPAAKKMAEWVLGRYDRNGDGKIDSEEVKSGRFADPPASESDTNNDGILSRAELLIRYQDREDMKNKAAGGGGSDREDRKDRDRDDSDRDDRDRVWGFRGRNRIDSPSSKSDEREESSSTKSSSAGARDVRKGYESYVDGIFKSYDKDSDGVLDTEELAKMRRKPSKSADADGDSKISKSELVEAYLVKAGQGRGGSKISLSSRTSLSSRSSKSTSSRVAGSRSQLTDKDANENGQIEMAEYETDWTKELIEEFNQIDKNEDGVITKAEWDAK